MKFGEKQHLEKMQNEGLFYCNTITYFSNIEDESRGDTFESVSKLEYFKDAVFRVKPANEPFADWKILNTTQAQYKEHYKEPLGNLFCMSAFQIKPTKKIATFYIDEKFLKFGYCLMILRQDLFMQRLKQALKKLDFHTCLKLTEYIDLHKYSGVKTLFQKDLKYRWQEELRIVLKTSKYKMYDPFEFSIGSIKDISVIIDLKKMKKVEYVFPLP